jgi:GntR family transcriptional regulator, vanillate catabolism transcriptional regulator
VAQNARFHTLLAEMSGSALVQRQIDRVATLPFASANAFVMAHSSGAQARDRLVIAHDQHHAVVEAIVQREGTRAQGLMQEHARNAQQNLAAVLQSHRALQRLPGASLIRRGGGR